ncbi:MAG: DUF1294 domain-containing protein [Clostridia bacterium]|nr:DUF1294 domain-containing protein [Clostridia bacterium]
MRSFLSAHWTVLACYILAVSLFAFCQMGFDKRRAKRDGWRVRERSLWLAAILGGGLGSFLGMKAFRHKTKHLAFQIGFPLLAALDLALLMWTLP